MIIQEYNFEEQAIDEIIHSIIQNAIEYGATDIHFDSKENQLVVKFRINGDLVTYTIIPDTLKYQALNIIKIIAGLNVSETSKFQNSTFTYKTDEIKTRVRCSCLPINYGEKIVYHISTNDIAIPRIDGLGFSPNITNQISSLIFSNTGAIIIAGGRVSGKNTTLYSILKTIDSERNNVISIEKKIKVQIDGVTQVPINNRRVSSILNDCLMLDPNIIAVDEIDSDETARAILQTANTGILVITTMQATSAYNALNALINMNIEGYLLSSAITGIISQKLIKRLCPNCYATRETTDYEKEVFKRYLGRNIETTFEPQGCEQCFQGYIGRQPLSEVIIFDEELKKLLINKVDERNIKKHIYETNESIIENGLIKVINGETTFDEIVRTIDLNTDMYDEIGNLKSYLIKQEEPTENEEYVEGQEEYIENPEGEYVEGQEEYVENPEGEYVEGQEEEYVENPEGEYVEGQEEYVENPDEEPIDEERVEGQEEYVENPDEEPIDEEHVEGQEEYVENPDEEPIDEEYVEGQEEYVENPDEEPIDEEPVEGQEEYVENPDEGEYVEGQEEYVENPDEEPIDEEHVEGQEEYVENPDEEHVEGQEEYVENPDEEPIDEEYVEGQEEYVENPEEESTEEETNETKTKKNIPSTKNLSTSLGSLSKDKIKTNYDDFDYDDEEMNAI